MKIKYNNSYIYVRGRVNKEYIEEATIIFMRNIQRSKKHEHDNKTRNIKEK